MSKPEFVQIGQNEDVASVKDRLSFLRGKNVLLIWPEEGTALTRKLDLVLVQREAMRRTIRLAIVTHDPLVIKHAEELNISTFETIGSSERGRWKRGRSKVFTNRFQRPKSNPDPEELTEVASRVRREERTQSFFYTYGVRIGVFFVFLALIAGIAYVVVPGATVYIVPAQQSVEAQVQIIADPSLQANEVDVENGLIPPTRLRLEVEDTASVPTTGSRDTDDVLALGLVTFINRTDTPITVPISTQVSTGTGNPVMFRTLQEATLAGQAGAEAEVIVEAMPVSSGEVGNVASNTINTVIGPLDNRIDVVNREPTTGGESRSLRTASEADRELLLALIRQQLQARAFVEMEMVLSPTQFIVDDTVRIIEERTDSMTFNVEIGEPAETLSLTMSAVVEGVVIDEELSQRIVFAYLSDQIPRGRVIDRDSIVYSRGPFTVDTATNTISFVMSGSAEVRGQVDEAILRERLAGRSVGDALIYLFEEVDIAEDTSPRIEVSPNWFGQMPLLPMRINIVTEES